jgi:hypothetical protein
MRWHGWNVDWLFDWLFDGLFDWWFIRMVAWKYVLHLFVWFIRIGFKSVFTLVTTHSMKHRPIKQ